LKEEIRAENSFLFIWAGKPLGKGTFGQVKQGTHILTGEKVSSRRVRPARTDRSFAWARRGLI